MSKSRLDTLLGARAERLSHVTKRSRPPGDDDIASDDSNAAPVSPTGGVDEVKEGDPA
jgi:hypothetical protein